MADHIERVVVQGEVELNTGNATKQLDNLKKPQLIKASLSIDWDPKTWIFFSGSITDVA